MKYLSAILLFLFVACQTICTEDDAKKIMGNWFLQKITFPQEMPLINAKAVKQEFHFDFTEDRPQRYIVHYIMADCDKCVNELKEIQNYLRKNRQKYLDTKFVFIATGPIDIYVKEAADAIKFEYPIYFNKEYQSFKVINKLPIDDKLYDNMLLDSQDRLLVFGAFYNNSKAENLYQGLLKCDVD